ncbi:hypothetical protein LCGC14_1613860 [marine sediment metagenome]|uniref:Uncharacterized protein n=1 Tax=marine sediment metagenome TaxID=412755 RepID=A0A0F9KN73_9ZZZZ
MESLLKHRKGQQAMNIASLGVVAIALVVAAVILGMGGTILEKIQGTQTDNSAPHDNETLIWAGNNTPIGFLELRVLTSSVILYNNGSVVNKGAGDNANYTVTSSSITIINTSDDEGIGGPKGVNGSDWVTSDLNVTYSYNYGSAARNSSNFGLTGVATVAEFIPTIAIVAVAAIIIGIILVFFGRKKEGEA